MPPLTLYQVLREEFEQFHGALEERYYTWKFQHDHITDPWMLAWRLHRAIDPLTQHLAGKWPAAIESIRRFVKNAGLDTVDDAAAVKHQCPSDKPEGLLAVLVTLLNEALADGEMWRHAESKHDEQAKVGKRRMNEMAPLGDNAPVYENRLLLEATFSDELAKVNETLSGLCAQIHQRRPAALCFSGGGIRSASFGLGVLQGLARCEMLDKFHYLSTVSGGGYLGGWLTAWIHRHPNGLAGVVHDLKNQPPKAQVETEPTPVQHLRHYSNYLNPRLGLLSADTWTLVATVARNILLNWLVLVPLLVAALMVPRLHVTLIQKNLDGWYGWSLLLGSLTGLVALVYMGFSRPSAWDPARPLPKWVEKAQSQGWFLSVCLLMLTVSAICLTSFWALFSYNQYPPFGLSDLLPDGVNAYWQKSLVKSWWQGNYLLRFVLYGAVMHLLAFGVYSGILWGTNRAFWRQHRRGKAVEFLAVIFVGAFWGLLVWLVATNLFSVSELSQHTQPLTEHYVSFGVPLFLATLLLATFIFVALTSKRFTEEDREWWARCGGWLLIAVVVWCVASAAVIFGPSGLMHIYNNTGKLTKTVLAAVGGVSGLLTIFGGLSPRTPASEQQQAPRSKTSAALNLATKLAAPIFAAILVIGISLAFSALVSWVATLSLCLCPTTDNTASCYVGKRDSLMLIAESLSVANGPLNLKTDGPLKLVHNTPFRLLAILMGLLAGIGSLFAFVVNINKFSLHGMYRNRLVRAYLGASRYRDERRPHPFTGFDPEDNLWMRDLLDQRRRRGHKRLMPVVNICLNLVKGRSLAWQQRKAASFTVSPLHAGNLRLGYRPSREYGGDEGITLGTATTISGAAVSPNMGYHSSPALAFLLTLFNARLGWWLGNPGTPGNKKDILGRYIYRKQSPSYAVRPIFAEALSLTNEDSRYVYLSDGGHFENLGLYEMVLRRCHVIVVSDGTGDGDCNFTDLGNAVHKIRVDLGIPIEFPSLPIFSKHDTANHARGQYFAIARIRYSCVDEGASDGVLIYIKPAVYGREPVDVVNYSKLNAEFPHQTTVDQYFDESQFESYRMLGSHVIEEVWRR